MWELDYKESWAPKNWCFWTVVLEKTLENPLDCKEIHSVYPKGNQSWMFIGMTNVEAEIPILWPPDAKCWLIGKDPDAEKDWSHRRRGQQKTRRLDGITHSWTNLSKWWKTGKPVYYIVCEATKSLTWLNDWTKKWTKRKSTKFFILITVRLLDIFHEILLIQKTSLFINRNELYIQKS